MTVRVLSSLAAGACVTAGLDAALIEWDVPFLTPSGPRSRVC
jgi:hypothetical protein